jgi:hypothetical protein
MWRRWAILVALVLVGCDSGGEPPPVPTLMVLPSPSPTLGASPTPFLTATPLPQVVGVPTPTPPFGSLGAFIDKLDPAQTIRSEFTDQNDQSHVYIFDGTTGQYVNIEMIRLTGTIDPVIQLYTPSGQLVAMDDNTGGNRNALLRNILLPEDGLYAVQASGEGFFGLYTITMVTHDQPDLITPTVETPVLPTLVNLYQPGLAPTPARAVSGTRLNDHTPVIGTIISGGDVNRFTLSAGAGSVITINASPLPGYDLPLKFEVFGPSGDMVGSAASSTSNAGGDALMPPLPIETTGAYVIFVTTEEPAIGEYVISFGYGSTYQRTIRGEAVPNVSNDGVIEKRGQGDLWGVYLNQDDVITAAVSVTEGQFDPILEITTDIMQTIAIDDNSGADNNPLITQARIPERGLYFFRIWGAQAAGTGSYSLVWRYVNLAPTATPLPGRIPLLTVDDIAPDNAYVFYAFQGQKGQRVEVSVEGLPGSDFDPVAVLLGPDGVPIAEGDDSGETSIPTSSPNCLPTARIRCASTGISKAAPSRCG